MNLAKRVLERYPFPLWNKYQPMVGVTRLHMTRNTTEGRAWLVVSMLDWTPWDMLD